MILPQSRSNKQSAALDSVMQHKALLGAGQPLAENVEQHPTHNSTAEHCRMQLQAVSGRTT
eukprot:6954854-Alexandrium_andersonii.AAC.1